MPRFNSQKTPQPYRPDFALYESRKQAWIVEHPKATPEEYTVAIRKIAQDCGI